MSNESAAPEMVDITPSEIAMPDVVADITPSEIAGPEIVADISAAEIAGPEIVADISAAEIAGPEIVADISAAEIAGPEIVADISAAEIAGPEIAVGIDYGHTFLEEAVDEQDLESVSVCPSRDYLLSVVLDGNWDKVVEIVTNNPSWLHTGITDYGDSILHMAVIDMKVEVIQALINIDPSSLRYTSNGGSSAFFVAAASGLVEIAEMMMQQDEELPYIRGIYRMTPLHRAVALGRQSMVTYLFKVTNDWRLYNSDRIEILIWSIIHDSFGNQLSVSIYVTPPFYYCLLISWSITHDSFGKQQMWHWNQAIKQCMKNNYIAAQNADKETPQDLFSKEHEELRKQGEEWIKKTAESCALVAALITTMVFSAAFQLPGGLNDSGSPVLVKNTSFVFFAMSNAVSLFTSTASILVFLSILTSRYAQRDFLKSLPLKLMIGQILLLISIATMVVSFTVTFFIIFQQGLRWPPIVVAILASVPVTLFAFQQFPLLAEMYYSTYKFSNTLLPGQQRVFKGTSSRLLAYYGRTFATIHGRVRDANHED